MPTPMPMAAPFSMILRQAARRVPSSPATPLQEAEETIGSLRLGRVKSFSQKSGWGFIQLVDVDESIETSRDVFFHRADVARAGPMDLRPGMMVHCHVVSTDKGEKASGILVIETDEEEGEAAPAPPLPVPAAVVPPAAPDTDPLEAALPDNISMAAYSLRGTGHRIRWECVPCGAANVIPGRLRVMVVCAACHHAHAVDQWLCRCGQLNRRDGRHCVGCQGPYATSCVELRVQGAEGASEDTPVEGEARRTLRRPLRRPGWQHSRGGWQHPLFDGPTTSDWCQEPAAPEAERRGAAAEPVAAHWKETLLWARDWLLDGRPTALRAEEPGTAEWLYRFSEEVCDPRHRLLCPAQGGAALVPNPCADLSVPGVGAMYEAIGVAVGLAFISQSPLHPALPCCLARALLGFPATMEDLRELDPIVWQKAELVMRHPSLEIVPMAFVEEITRYGATRSFTSTYGPDVTPYNRHLYGPWLAEVHLRTAIDAPLSHLRAGLVAVLRGAGLQQAPTPEELAKVVTGRSAVDIGALRVAPTLKAAPALDAAVHQVLGALTPPQKTLLLRLLTGVGKAPHGGLETLDPPPTLFHDPRLPLNSLPVADPRTRRLVLPAYQSRDTLRQMLLAALASQPVGLAGFSHAPWTVPVPAF